MKHLCTAALGAAAIVLSTPTTNDAVAATAADVHAIFAETCFKCHSDERQKGDLRVDTQEWIEKGGSNGVVLVPGNPDESKLYTFTILPPDDPDIMPAKGDPLTKDQTEVIREWIAAGASFDGWPAPGEAPAETETAAEMPAEPERPIRTDVPKEEDPAEVLKALSEGVSPAGPDALAPIEETGAVVLTVSQKSPMLSVDFSLLGEEVKDEHLALLGPVAQQLTWLNLANTAVTNTGLAALNGLTKLTKLHLEKTQIGDEALVWIAPLKNLRYLNLYGTQVTDAGLEKLKGLTNLNRLYLWQTNVSEAGVAGLQEALPKCRIDTGWEPAPEPPADEAPAEAPVEEAA